MTLLLKEDFTMWSLSGGVGSSNALIIAIKGYNIKALVSH